MQEHRIDISQVKDITTGIHTVEDFAKMGYQARLKLFKEHPTEYERLQRLEERGKE